VLFKRKNILCERGKRSEFCYHAHISNEVMREEGNANITRADECPLLKPTFFFSFISFYFLFLLLYIYILYFKMCVKVMMMWTHNDVTKYLQQPRQCVHFRAVLILMYPISNFSYGTTLLSLNQNHLYRFAILNLP
jgi:hypothetical protein